MKYRTPAAFRQALDVKLRALAGERGQDLSGLQRRASFERFLARLFGGDRRWILKGGYALELRLGNRARATLDIDLSVPPPPYADLLEVLREAADQDLGDFFVFRLTPARLPLQGPPLGGVRFSVETLLDGKPYSRFVVDVGQGDEPSGVVEWMTGQIDLGFAELPPARFAVYPLSDHFAEKLHAYSKPRENPTRVKDLLDLALLLDMGLEASPALARAIQAVFDRYATHPLPESLTQPPTAWARPFSTMAEGVGLEPADALYWHGRLEELYRQLKKPGE